MRIFDPLQRLGLKSFGRSISLDTYTKLSPAKEGEEILEDFLFIDIDEQSLSNLGQWPWPRKIFAEAISKILDAEPAVLGIDILLAESDRFNPISLEELAGDKGQGISQYFVDGDKALFEVLEEEPVVLATSLSNKIKNTPKNVANILVKNKARFDIRTSPGIIFPIDQLANLEGYGFVNVDLDGVDNNVKLFATSG